MGPELACAGVLFRTPTPLRQKCTLLVGGAPRPQEGAGLANEHDSPKGLLMPVKTPDKYVLSFLFCKSGN